MTAIDAPGGFRAQVSDAATTSGQILPTRVQAVLAALAALTAAVLSFVTSFEMVDWSPAQVTVVGTEAAAFWGLVAAATAHFVPNTKKQPVALAGAVTAFASTTLSLNLSFGWWEVSEAQNASLVGVVIASVAAVSALIARSNVTPIDAPRQQASNTGGSGIPT
ncbi:hypothetical protein [Aldersonia kunmingensis]|uniref:hypothetical protein n=1 Tax=Aldersonia kunmingensis TaxID=408066 RepID=UPI00083463EE|nr:hypothetical protein [Aldersonia kunmingensis]